MSKIKLTEKNQKVLSAVKTLQSKVAPTTRKNIAKATKLTESSVSWHLQVLKAAKALIRGKDGKLLVKSK